MLTKEDRAAMRERCEAARPGPWVRESLDESSLSSRVNLILIRETPIAKIRRRVTIGDLMTHEDAEFIAHARQDIPTLLDALDELEADRNHWKARADELERPR